MGNDRRSPKHSVKRRQSVRCTSAVTPGTSSCSSSSIPAISITARGWKNAVRCSWMRACATRTSSTALGTTIALLVLAMLYTKQWIDHRRAMWITAEMMTDLYNHDAYSRGVAREAIQKYNDHIERCNRAIEAAEHGMSIPGADSDTNDLKSQLQSVADERDSYKRERDLAKRDLQEKEKLIAEMSLRVDAVAKKTDPNQVAASSVDMSAADPNGGATHQQLAGATVRRASGEPAAERCIAECWLR